MAATLAKTTEGNNLIIWTWTGLANGESGTAVRMHDYADVSIQVEGTFGAAGNLQWQGSNDGTNFRPLNDSASSLLNIAAAGIEAVLECVLYMRPKVTAGDGTTLLNVTLVGRRIRDLKG